MISLAQSLVSMIPFVSFQSSSRSYRAAMVLATDDDPPTAAPPSHSRAADDELSSPCKQKACNHPNYRFDAAGNRTMITTKRLPIVRCISYAMGVATEAEVCSDLIGEKCHRMDLRLRRTMYRQSHGNVGVRCLFIYAIYGRKTCRDAFTNLVGLNADRILRHAEGIRLMSSFVLYELRHNESHDGNQGIQRRSL